MRRFRKVPRSLLLMAAAWLCSCSYGSGLMVEVLAPDPVALQGSLRDAAAVAGFFIDGPGCRSGVIPNATDFCASMQSADKPTPLTVSGHLKDGIYHLSAVRINQPLATDESVALLAMVNSLRADGIGLCARYRQPIANLSRELKKWMKVSCNVA